MEFGGGENGKDILYYTETDQANRPFMVWRMDLKDFSKNMVYVDDNEINYLELSKSKDGKYIIISSNTKEDSEIRILPQDSDP